jgi:hypothetical protein
MAQTIAFQRSTSQVVTIDTINNIISPLGPALSGSIPTTTTGFPAGIQNTNIVFLGDPYTLVITGAGNIEVRRYDTPSNTWILSSPSFTPLSSGNQMPICLQVVNGELVALWTNSAGTSTVISGSFYNGTAWSPRVNSQLTTMEYLTLGAISGSFNVGDTVTQGSSSGVVAAFNPTTSILTVNVTTSTPFTTGGIADTTSTATSTVTFADSAMDGNTGGNSIVWRQAVWFATKAGLAHFIPGRITFGSPITLPTFVVGETVTGGSSGAIAIISDLGTIGISPTQYFIDVTPTSGSFTVGETITASTSLQTINISSPIGTFSVGDILTFTGGISGSIRQIVGSPTPTSFVVGLISGLFPNSSPPSALIDSTSGATATITSSSSVYYATATVGTYCFGPIDTGSDPSVTNPFLSNIVPQGCFSFWNNNLYFVLPDTGGGIKLYSLNPNWASPAPTPPQWSLVLNVTGILSSGTMVIGPDIGNYCLFVNKNEQLSLFHSGPNGTRLATSSMSSFPAFTDVTVNILPSSLTPVINQGISVYIDNRRRLNELQWFLIRNSAITGNTLTLASWDGVNPLVIQTQFPEADYLLPAGRNGELRTFTNLQPTCSITAINTTTSPAFPGRAVISYLVRDTFSRNVDTFGEYSIDGDIWLPMTEGDGDDGSVGLATSPSGTPHTFYWDAFADLAGTYTFLNIRMIARISVATNEVPPNQFVAIIQEGYTQEAVPRNLSQYRLFATPQTGLFLTGDTVTGVTSGATATSHFAGTMLLLSTTPTGVINVNDTVTVGESTGTVIAAEPGNSLYLTLALSSGFSVGDTVMNTDTGATGQLLGLSGVNASIYVTSGVWPASGLHIKDLSTSTTTSYSGALLNPAIVVSPAAGSQFTPGVLSDTVTSASATVSVADLTEVVFSTVGTFLDGEIINDDATIVLTLSSGINFNTGDSVTAGSAAGTIGLKTQLLTLTSATGFNIGDIVTQGGASGTVINISSNIITVNVSASNFAAGAITDTTTSTTTTVTVLGITTISVIVGAGSFSPGAITDTTTTAVSSITTVAQSTAIITGIISNVITVTTLPADETTDLEEFHQAISIATRSHAQLVFQGRLSTNQTLIRFIKLTIRGLGPSPMAQISVFVSGFGPNNQYTGSYSTFQTMPTSDLEIVINENNLMNQPSAAGKLYSVVVEFNLADGDSGVVSTPFFRHE